eukprot:augustus_masked-scaffold_19-processed-gene-4.37-mRNA-1 protein AED:0.39 eAED:0.40 QI:0/-1/0/1/-1/1/1/0/1346
MDRVPKLRKLGLNGDIYDWIAQLQAHFETLGFWEHVSEGTQIEVQDAGVSVDLVKARCRRDLLGSLEMELVVAVRHYSSAYEMFRTIKRMFVGSVANQKRKLRQELAQITFERDYFRFMTRFQALVAQLDSMNGVISWQDLSLNFLERLPKSLSMVTHSLKRVAESSPDARSIWETTFDAVLDYLMDSGLYHPGKNSQVSEREMAMKTGETTSKKKRKKKKKSSARCFGCGKKGHYRSECPEKNSKKGKESGEKPRKNQREEAWMCAAKLNEKRISFILDSGATQHVCGEGELFSNKVRIPERQISTASGEICTDKAGDVKLTLENGKPVSLSGALYWPGAPRLLSVAALTAKGVDVSFSKDVATIMSKGKVVYKAKRCADGLFRVHFLPKEKAMVSLEVWHNRLNHCSEDRLVRSVSSLVKKDAKLGSRSTCVGCMKGKLHRVRIPKVSKFPTERKLLELLVADTVGPYDMSIDRKSRALVVTDARSQFQWSFPFGKKSEVVALMVAHLSQLDRVFPGQVQFLRTDNGTEFCNEGLDGFLSKKGIKHQVTVAYEHEQNGRAENSNRILLENTRSLIKQAGLSRGFWSFAMKCATHAYNFTKLSREDISPWELLYGVKPPLEKLRIFGVVGFAHVHRENRRKLDDTATKVMFLGYGENFDGYIVRDVTSGRIFATRSFFCDEQKFLDSKSTLLGATGEQEESLSEFFAPRRTLEEAETFDDDVSEFSVQQSLNRPQAPVVSNPEHEVEPETAELYDTPLSEESEDVFSEPVEENDEGSETSDSPIASRLRSSVRVPERFKETLTSLRPGNQPGSSQALLAIPSVIAQAKLQGNLKKGFKSYKEALASNDEWEKSYLDEISKLEKQGELKIVPRRKEMRCIPFREVLTEKIDNISGAVKRKVRLAARGDLQFDRPENCYSPAAGALELRLFICLAKGFGWYVKQGDCPSAYLNGRMDEPVYLLLPNGHPRKTKANDMVYECWASLYGLAIAGQVWYWKFVDVVKHFGLKPSARCPSLFSCEKDGASLWLVLYVDDFLIGSKDLRLMALCEVFLLEKFKVKCTSEVNKFVGLQLMRGKSGVAIHQDEKIHDMGTRYRITKFPSKPMIENLKWDEKSVALDDIKPLQKLFGELNYLSTMSRPDISYAVNRIARRLHDGTKEVYRRAKSILAYLCGTSDLGLVMKRFSGSSKLELFCDASFADDKLEKFRSTGGFLIFLNGGLIHWKSKKIKMVCTSTAQSEYLSLYAGAKEVMFVARLLEDFFGMKTWPINVYVDNQAVLNVIDRAAPSDMNKHMATKYYALQQWTQEGLLELEYVASKLNLSDIMTKVSGDFVPMRNKLLHPRGSVGN